MKWRRVLGQFAWDEKGSEVLENVAVLGFVTLPLAVLLMSASSTIYDTLWYKWRTLADLAFDADTMPRGDRW